MMEIPDANALKTKQRDNEEGFPAPMKLRVRRAISWIGRAETEARDDDVRVIFLWIAFNAAYADKQEFTQTARTDFLEYLRKLVRLDAGRIRKVLGQRNETQVKLLIGNKYVLDSFWQHHNEIMGHENWEEELEKSKKKFHSAFKFCRTEQVLKVIFDRLYVLRNQLVHGGATWNSNHNRDTVILGAAILGSLVPVFIDIMMDNHKEKWGEPFYSWLRLPPQLRHIQRQSL